MNKRIRLKYRDLPDYTKGEEIFNMTSHIVAASFSFIGLILCIVFSVLKHDLWSGVASSIYGVSLVTSFTISSVYHGLNPNMGKKVMQVLNHCFVYFVIAGTYTPILICAVRPTHPFVAWLFTILVWALCIMGTVFTAIDLEMFDKLSMICYIGIGWILILAIRELYEVLTINAFLLIIFGGIVYTIGAFVYIKGRTKRYYHSIFHLFVITGATLHFIAIFKYIIM